MGRLCRLASAAIALVLLAGHAAPAQDYPTRPVTMVVPFAPGGGVDQMARLMAQKARAAARQDLRDREQAGRRQHHRRDRGA